MSFYEDRMLPYLVSVVMRNRRLVPYRQRVLAGAEGRVLELGIGSGLNLPFYGAQVREVVGIDPAPRLVAMARRAAAGLPMPVTLIEGGAEAIPLDDASMDAVVVTWTLCTVGGIEQALAEIRRVLKRDGSLLFVEHGQAPDPGVRKWQDWLTPAWRRIAGGCHLNRPIHGLIERNGFAIAHLETGYLPGPKPFTFLYEGRAKPRTAGSRQT